MVVAAYVVGGFLIASVYAFAMLRGRRDRYHRLGFLIAFTRRRRRDSDPDGASATRWPAGSTTTSPMKFAAIELVPKTASDVPETLFGHLNADGTVSGGHPDPRPGVVAVGPGRPAPSTVVQGLDTVPGRRAADRSPRSTSCTSRGTSWSGSARCCCCCRSGTGCAGCSGATCRGASGSCWLASAAGVAVGDHDGGGLGGERGRPPTVDRLQPHEGRGRGHRQHRRVDHVHRRRRCCTSALGVTTDPRPAQDEPAVPRPRRWPSTTCRTARAAPARRAEPRAKR